MSRDVQYKSSLAAVAAQQAFASAHTAEWEKRTGDDDKTTYDTMMSVWEPRSHVMMQIDSSDDKKELKNMGKSSDVALIAGRAVADKVVATQESTMSTNNSLHAAAMAKAAADSTAHKTSVWVPRNAVYAQKSVPGLPNMGSSSDVALTAGRAVANKVVSTQEGTMGSNNSDHAAAMSTAADAATAHKTSVWVPRNAVYAQKNVPGLPNMGSSSDVALTAGRAVADKVVATQEGTMGTNNSLHATAMSTAADAATAHKTSVWVPRNAVYAQYEGLPNMGNSQNVSHGTQTKISEDTVAAQQKFAADHLAAHEAATAKAADLTAATMANVWIPRNAVYAQKSAKVDDLPNMGDSQAVARAAGDDEAKATVAAQKNFAATFAAGHAAATANAATLTANTMEAVWTPRNKVFGRGYLAQKGVDNLPHMGTSSDHALQAGAKVAASVVASQEKFMANANSTHATAMDTAANAATAHKTSVWVPRNAVY